MNNTVSSKDDVVAQIDEEYQQFLVKLDLLKKEQWQLVKEYRNKLEQRRLLQLRKGLDIKRE